MNQDPGKLLQRIPQLQVLCDDEAVRDAVASGDPFRVYRALRKARQSGRLPAHQELLDELLHQRRLFTRLIRGRRMWGHILGIGTRLLGHTEVEDRDSSSIATRYLVVFGLPVLPLGAYLVRPVENVYGVHRGWKLAARAPMGLRPWLYCLLVVLGGTALISLAAWRFLHGAVSQEVHVVNGFSEPLRVEMGGRTQDVPALSRRHFFVPTGEQQVRAVTRSGAELDVGSIFVDPHADLVVWNIAGAAPLFRKLVIYTRDPRNAPPPSRPEFFCGRRSIATSANYAFRPPPERAYESNIGNAAGAVRTHVDVLPNSHGPDLCFTVLAAEGRLADAQPFTEAAARLSGWKTADAVRAIRAAMESGPEVAARVIQAALQARPEDVVLHRYRQLAAVQAGTLDALQDEYRQRAEAQPDSASAQYLYARLQRGHGATAALERLARRFPEDPHILREVLDHRWRTGNWQGTLDAWNELRALDGSQAGDTEAVATALVALGKRDEAVDFLEALFGETRGADLVRIAELHARVAASEKGSTPDFLIGQLERETLFLSEAAALRLRARAELPMAGGPDRLAARFMSTVRRDPQEALRIAAQLPSQELYSLSTGAWALGYGEAVRTGDAAAEKGLGQARRVDPASLEVLRRFVRGEAISLEDAWLTPEVRAAACFVRSRNTALPAAERQRLIEQARRDVWFHGVISAAMASWAP